MTGAYTLDCCAGWPLIHACRVLRRQPTPCSCQWSGSAAQGPWVLSTATYSGSDTSTVCDLSISTRSSRSRSGEHPPLHLRRHVCGTDETVGTRLCPHGLGGCGLLLRVRCQLIPCGIIMWRLARRRQVDGTLCALSRSPVRPASIAGLHTVRVGSCVFCVLEKKKKKRRKKRRKRTKGKWTV